MTTGQWGCFCEPGDHDWECREHPRHKLNKVTDTQRLNWLLKFDPYGRNRRFIDSCIKEERREKAERKKKQG